MPLREGLERALVVLLFFVFFRAGRFLAKSFTFQNLYKNQTVFFGIPLSLLAKLLSIRSEVIAKQTGFNLSISRQGGWEDCTNQVVSVTDGSRGCSTAQCEFTGGDANLPETGRYQRPKAQRNPHDFNVRKREKSRETAGSPIMKIRNIYFSIAGLVIAGLVTGTVTAQDGTLPNYMFSQYYTQPGASSVNAELYVAPHPVPANVGHSDYTYQPLMPHEMLYQHSRNYYNWTAGSDAFYHSGCRYPCGGALNKTTVHWQATGYRVGNMACTSSALERCRNKLAKHRYKAPGFGRICHGGNCATGNCSPSNCSPNACASTGFQLSDTVAAKPNNSVSPASRK